MAVDENNKSVNDIPNYDYIEYIAGNNALFNISKKYLAVVIGGIFAIIVQKPEIVKQLYFRNINLSKIIMLYILIGVFGLFIGEVRNESNKLLNIECNNIPMWLKKACSTYCMLGFMIFISLFIKLIS